LIHDSEEYRSQPWSARMKAESEEGTTAFDARLLEFSYPYARETGLPAKVTATQLKGRLLDEEIAEHTVRSARLRPLTQPKFRHQHHGLTPAERGTATHLVLQYLDFFNHDVAAQVEDLRRRMLLSDQQAEAVDTKSIGVLLDSPLAEEIRGAEQVLREYRFTLLMDVKDYDPTAAGGDHILLQGVVDCCFETAEGLTVVDFKTDHVSTAEDTIRRAEEYRSQLEAYSLALERVLGKCVTRRALYFLKTGMTVEV